MAAGGQNIHGTSVAVDGKAVLLRGRAGSGKSDLALRLIDAGGVLIADDQTLLRRDGARVVCSAPPEIAGRLEVRGIGIVETPCVEDVPLGLVVDMAVEPADERLPEAGETMLLGCAVPTLDLFPFEASAVAKLKLALRHHGGDA